MKCSIHKLAAVLLTMLLILSGAAHSSDFGTLIDQGLTAFRAGNLDNAQTAFQSAVELNPKSAEAHYYLGYVLSEKYRNSQSEASMKHLADQMNNKTDKNPTNTTEKEMQKIYISYGLQPEYETKAIQEFKRVVELDPDAWMARYFIAVNHLNNKRYSEAEKEYIEGIRANPKHVISYGGLGSAYHAMGKYDLAIKNYKKSIALDGDISDTNLELARAYMETNQLEKAEAILKEMKEQNHILYGSLYMLLYQKMPNE